MNNKPMDFFCYDKTTHVMVALVRQYSFNDFVLLGNCVSDCLQTEAF